MFLFKAFCYLRIFKYEKFLFWILLFCLIWALILIIEGDPKWFFNQESLTGGELLAFWLKHATAKPHGYHLGFMNGIWLKARWTSRQSGDLCKAFRWLKDEHTCWEAWARHGSRFWHAWAANGMSHTWPRAHMRHLSYGVWYNPWV